MTERQRRETMGPTLQLLQTGLDSKSKREREGKKITQTHSHVPMLQ